MMNLSLLMSDKNSDPEEIRMKTSDGIFLRIIRAF